MKRPEDPDRILDHYRLEACVAAGGIGEIWRATDLYSGEQVAIKRLLAVQGEALARKLRRRLEHEGRAIQRLDHPHIVRHLESGLDDGDHPYLAMEWLEGESLQQRHVRRPLRLDETLEVARQALSALSSSHALGILHRDVKPSNMYLLDTDEGVHLKLVDFGLAFLGGSATRLTRTGEVLGTPCYMSPEQVRGLEQVDLRTDLYAMGVVLYWLVTGALPFSAQRPMTVLLKIVNEIPPRPGKLRPDLPLWLEQVILNAMARSAEGRYATAEAMLADLDAGAAGEPVADLGDGPAVAADALADTVVATSPRTAAQVRQVIMLCVRRVSPLEDLPPAVFRAVESAGGRINVLLGGEVVGLFGLDGTRGDEALRAIRAGLAVRRHVRHRARLLVAAVRPEATGGLQLSERDLDRGLGTVNRLPPGELFVEAAARRLAGDGVQVERRGAMEAVVSLSSRAPLATGVLGEASPMVGRETELASLRAALDRCLAEEEPEVVLVLGAPGVGKSRMFSEALTFVREECQTCLVTHADAALDHVLEEAARALRQAGPVALCLEDLHRADDEFLVKVETLLQSQTRYALFVLATARPELLSRRPGFLQGGETTSMRLELKPLGSRPLRRWLMSVIGEETARAVEELVLDHSGGNPRAAEELLTTLVDRQVLVKGPDGWALEGNPSDLALPGPRG